MKNPYKIKEFDKNIFFSNFLLFFECFTTVPHQYVFKISENSTFFLIEITSIH